MSKDKEVRKAKDSRGTMGVSSDCHRVDGMESNRKKMETLDRKVRQEKGVES
jgi:hypothetical protein